jgi:hypothetical protein
MAKIQEPFCYWGVNIKNKSPDTRAINKDEKVGLVVKSNAIKWKQQQ